MIPHVEARQSTIAHIRDKFNNPNKVKIVMDFFDIFFWCWVKFMIILMRKKTSFERVILATYVKRKELDEEIT
jgi:hypothetical protein